MEHNAEIEQTRMIYFMFTLRNIFFIVIHWTVWDSIVGLTQILS